MFTCDHTCLSARESEALLLLVLGISCAQHHFGLKVSPVSLIPAGVRPGGPDAAV